MSRWTAGLIALLLPCTAVAEVPVALHANYETFAAGLQVAGVDAALSLGPSNYQMDLGFHTTGLVGVVFRGHQLDHVDGSWAAAQAVPSRFIGKGVWRGADRLVEIEYQRGKPLIRHLEPPNTHEREPVPDALQANSIDTLSAFAQLIHVVANTGRCETTVHTYDGRRAVEIEAHTVAEEVLQPSDRSRFAGKALRCDFSGQLLAGFKFDDDRTRAGRPMHGSAWLAPVLPSAPPLPVRMAFETKWFGDVTMYLTAVGPGADMISARGN